MIARDEVLPLLDEACPSFVGGRPGPTPPGAVGLDELGRFAHHVVDLAARGDAEELPAVFGVLDRVLVEGDHDAVVLVRTGLVEELQNITSHRDVPVDGDELATLLGPAANAVWAELDEAWTAAAARGAEHHGRIPAEDYLLLGRDDRRRIQSMTRELPDGTLARPSDVLRYEVEELDDALLRRRHLWRQTALWLLLIVVVVAGAAVLVS